MPCTDKHCTNPNCRGTPAYDQIAAMIREHGQFVMAVMGDDESPGFAYTIGRTERGQPELLVFATNFDDLMELGGLLNYLGPRDVQDGHLIAHRDGEVVFAAADLSNFPELLAHAHEDLVVQADHYYGRQVDLMYLVELNDRELHLAPDDIEVTLMNAAPGLH